VGRLKDRPTGPGIPYTNTSPVVYGKITKV
jgi:hypothetical protein